MKKLTMVSIVVLGMLVITEKSSGDGASIAKAPTKGYSKAVEGLSGAGQSGIGAVQQGATAPANGYGESVDSVAGKSSGGKGTR